MRLNKFLTTFLLAACSTGMASTVIFSEDFNSQNGGAGALTLSALTNWTVAGNLDLIGSGTPWDLYPGHGLYLDMDGTGSVNGGPNATITTTASFGPGSYILDFLLGINGNNNLLSVSLGDFSTSLVPTNTLTPVHLAFTTSVSGSLAFSEQGNPDNQGSVIDEIFLSTPDVSPSGSVPEPATLGLSGIAMAMLAFGALRSRAAK